VVFDCTSLESRFVRPSSTLPIQPATFRKHRGDIVREEVIPDLSQFRDSRRVTPRELRVRRMTCVSRIDIPAELCPLGYLVLTGVIPFKPPVRDGFTQLVGLE